MLELEELKENMQASQELLKLYEGFRSKARQLYTDRLISAAVYSDLVQTLRSIYCIVTSDLMAQERKFERAGGVFYEVAPTGNKGMYTKKRS